MVMEQRVSVITLGVADLDRAVAFYERVIGWKAAPSPSEIAFFDLGGVVLSLYPHDALVKDMNGATQGNDDVAYQGFALAYNTRSKEEVDSIFSRLKVGGATITKEPEEVFWGGYSGYFLDPDGHAWEVAYNPHWSIRKDGRVSMAKG
jgi:catechol 2,3-dioxygenase-like lactoylglutathione lyase family enzyme